MLEVPFAGWLPGSTCSTGGCEVPGVAVVFEAEVDQPFEVDDGCSSRERQAVAFNSVVSASAVAVGDEPCDSALDHWSMLAIVRNEVGVGSPTGPVGGEVMVVCGDDEYLAVDC